MGLFDSGTDPSTDTNAAFLMPQVAQAYRNDPRQALIQAMMQTSRDQLNQPTYTPLAALAKALTGGIGAGSSAYLQKQYADASAGAPAELSAAMSSKDPMGALVGSSNPITRMIGFQLAPAVMAKRIEPTKLGRGDQLVTAAGGPPLASNTAPLSPEGAVAQDAANATDPTVKAALTSALLKGSQDNGITFTPSGAAPVLNYGPAAGVIGAAKITAETPPTVDRAVQTAKGTAPINAFIDQFHPQIDRNNGAIIVPGIEKPEITAAIMKQFGVTPQDVIGRLGAVAAPTVPAAGAAPAAQPPASVAPATPAPAASPVAPMASPAVPPAPVPAGTKKPIDEVPTVPLPTGLMPGGAGTIIQGRDPVKIKAAEGAVENATKQYEEVADAAKNAGQVRAQLGTMKTMLQSGDVNSSATAPARQTLATYLNATLGPDAAKAVTGLDPAKTEVFNKDAVRMGLQFARQTEGAREAVAAIKIALGGNPSLANTKEGNLKIIDLMDAGVQHDLDAQKYGQAYFDKNGHTVGFQDWMSQNHPPAEYTSKVVPYNLPRSQDGAVDTSGLQPNVTYQGKNGAGIWNGQGFIPVKR